MSQLVRCAQVVRHTGTFLLHFAHGGLVMAGVMVLALIGYQVSHAGVEGLNPRLLFNHGESADSVAVTGADAAPVTPVIAAASSSSAAASSVASVPTMGTWASVKHLTPELVRLSDYIAKRYKVSKLVVQPLVQAAVREGHATGVDPILILAVTSVESRFNPLAESVVGAQGLMQIIPRFHSDKITASMGKTALFDPNENLRVGALILKEYIKASGGLDRALQMYGGAPNDSSMFYANKVNTELNRLREVMKTTPSRAEVASDRVATEQAS
ncbi:transglycosylase SLT domain-containing protein [Uliginosibacterium sp. sgz301328]|uniref:transglycosylase SLT domain-containing protein n=1 Tax=Uliginosibacterium sp. sgz301328 TaxID=3243764 RepID=UPI00359F071D